MTIAECITNATTLLKEKEIESARLDTLILLEKITGKDRSWLLANPGLPINLRQEQELIKLLNQRMTNYPIAYILKRVEFYGYQFVVNDKVLVPRPESESIINLLLELFKPGS